jgi:putative heme iron utilization protein
VAEAQSNAKTRGEVVNLEEHFAQFPKGEEIVLQSVLPQGIDPNSNSQKINQSGMNNV